MATASRFRIARAKCAQCGKELKNVPFAIENIVMCKDCYGIDRYRRAGSAIADRQDAPAVEEESTA